MGIPGFFNLVSNKYNLSISKKLPFIDVFLDFNSLIYNSKFYVFNLLYNYFKFKLNIDFNDFDLDIITDSRLDSIIQKIKNNILLDSDDKNIIIDIRDDMIYKHITEQCKTIIRTNITVASFHIFMDGVPTCSKIIEQRKRAIVGSLMTHAKDKILTKFKDEISEIKFYIEKEIEPLINLDRNLIKPGTEFMKLLGKYLEKENKNIIIDLCKINNKVQNERTFGPSLRSSPLLKDFQEKSLIKGKVQNERTFGRAFNGYTFSGVDKEGEAEHKILDVLIKENYKNILVYSPDADMIILLLPLTRDKNIYLIRDIKKPDIYDIKKLYKDIINHIKKYLKEKQIKKSRVIKDICFIYNLFGNDFIPKLDNINIYDNKVIDHLLKKYVLLYEKSGCIINKKGNINWKNYLQYLKYINNIFENPKIITPYNNKKLENNYENQIYSLDNFNRGLYRKNNDKYIWNLSFYDNKQFFDTSKNNIIKDYIVSIFMINILYSKIYYKINKFESRLTYIWFYIHHKSPLLTDIIEYLENNIKDIRKKIRKHFKKFSLNHNISGITPIQQLYYTIPVYEDFIQLVPNEHSVLPKLKQHYIYDEYLKTLKWDEKTKLLNISDIIDCNLQRYIEKCVPLYKKDNKYINLVFDIKYYLK